MGVIESNAGHSMMADAYGLITSELYLPENVPREQRRVGPEDHYRVVQMARARQRHEPERQHRESVEDLARRFAALSLNDQTVMNVVRNRSLFSRPRNSFFRTDR